jgi:hypothetical protein
MPLKIASCSMTMPNPLLEWLCAKAGSEMAAATLRTSESAKFSWSFYITHIPFLKLRRFAVHRAKRPVYCFAFGEKFAR